MDIIRFAIDNPVKVSVGVILLILGGVLAFTRIPIQLTPDVDAPIITITTEWTGRNPEEVEREIIEEQEDVLKNLENLRKMTATAFEGRGEIELEFSVGTDIDNARTEVSDALRQVPDYPEEVDEPVVTEGEANAESPIAWLILDCADPSFDVQTLGDAAEERIKPALERVPGVSEVRVYGGRAREVHLEFDPSRIAQHGITFNQLRRALQLENVNISAGSLAEGRRDWRVRTVGQYEDLDQVRNTIVAYTPGGPVRIRDLAEVKLTFEKRRMFVRSKGEVALALPVNRESGSNVMEVMAALKRRVAELNAPGGMLEAIAAQTAIERGLPEPPPLKLTQVYDETIYIDDAIGLVESNLLIGGTLAILALIVFLRAIRPTLVVALAIPISVVGTFVFMALSGRNLNVISLAGLAFAVGMVVDNAIVVLENIDRHLGMGKGPARAAYDATREVWGAILASTLTTLVVFVPVLFVEEEAGQLFRDITLAICAAVTLSLIVAVTVIPAASARWLRRRREKESPLKALGHSLFGLAPVFNAIGAGFANLIHWLCAPNFGGVAARLGIVALFTLVSIAGAYLLMPPTDYLPRGNQNLVFGFLLTPPGYNIEQDEFIAERIERGMRPYWEAESQQDLTGQPPVIHPFTQQPIENISPVDNYFIVSFFGGVFTGSISSDKENVQPLAGLLTAEMNQIPGSIGFAEQRSLFGRGMSGTRAIEVEVSGFDLDHVRDSAEALMGALGEEFGFEKVQPNPPNFNQPGPELRLEIDRVKAADLGIDVASLGLGVQALIDGMYVGEYRLSGESIDILALRDPDLPLMPERLGATPIAYIDHRGHTGTIPLSSIATIEPTTSPDQIRRVEEQRTVTLQITPPDEMPLESAEAKIMAITGGLQKDGAIPPDVTVVPAGSADKLREVRRAMLGKWTGWNAESFLSLINSRILIALLVVYLLMAALFESFLYPAVIMFAVPLATLGGFIGLALMHAAIPTQQLDVLTMLGFVILIGVVVNNAILIVHQALNFMRGVSDSDEHAHERLAPRAAIRESVRTRIRPVLMTTMTSSFGMAPLVLMPGAGSELYKGLGSVVIGGLIVATLFTLIVVPLLFSLVLDFQQAVVRVAGAAREVVAEPAH